jgi:hypothetical protein
VQQWLLQPSSFFDGFFLTALVLCALAWHRAGVVAALFYRLALTPGELAWGEEQRLRAWWWSGRQYERAQISRSGMVDDYITQWLIGGALLVFCAGATRVRIDQDALVDLFSTGVPDQVIVAVVLYFITGLILVSQARLAQMRALWYFDGVPISAGLPGRWNRLSLVVVVTLGLLATLLPLGSTWQLGAMINIIAGVVIQIALGIVAALIALFSLILVFFGRPPPAMPQLPAPAQAAPAAPPVTITLPPWLGGAGLWLAIIVVVVIALRFLLGSEGLAVTRRRLRALAGRILALLARWWRSARSAAQGLALLPGRRAAGQAAQPGSRPGWRFLRLGALSPRERVRYFYLSTVRRAARLGVVRRPGQTPHEFLHDLEQTLPEAEQDVAALTDAFITARYNTTEITPAEAASVRTIWERIKRALRRDPSERAAGGARPQGDTQ